MERNFLYNLILSQNVIPILLHSVNKLGVLIFEDSGIEFWVIASEVIIISVDNRKLMDEIR